MFAVRDVDVLCACRRSGAQSPYRSAHASLTGQRDYSVEMRQVACPLSIALIGNVPGETEIEAARRVSHLAGVGAPFALC